MNEKKTSLDSGLDQHPVNSTGSNIEPEHESEPEQTSDTTSGPNLNLNAAASASEFPDGGLTAWSVVLGGWCSLFVSFGWITCIGVFQTEYQASQLRTYSPSTIAWIPSVETFVMFVGAPFFGKLFDSYGSRWIMIVGTGFHVFGLMMLSISKQYYQIFLAQSVCSAIGSSAIFWAANNAVGTWFAKRRGLALGIVSSGSSVGGIVGTAVIPHLFKKIGFGWTMRAVAFLYLFLLSIPIVTVKSRLVHTPKKFRAGDIVRPLKEPPLLKLAIAGFFFFLGVFLPYNFMVVEAEDSGMSSSLANNLLVVLCTTSVLGRIIPGWLGDRYGRFNLMIIFTYLSTILVLALWIPASNDNARIAFAALYGFSSGTFVSMIPTLIAQVCSDVKRIGAYMGATYLVLSAAILMAQPIGGALVGNSHKKGYTHFKIFCGVTMFVGGCAFVVARRSYGLAHGGRKGRKI